MINFLYAALSGGTLQQSDVTAVHLSNGIVHQVLKILLFMKMHLPPTCILKYVRSEMIVHASIIKLDQLDYLYPRKIQNFENLCIKSMESCSLVISQILAELRPERAAYKTLHYLNLLKSLLLGF